LKIDFLRHRNNDIYFAFRIGDVHLSYNTIDFCYEISPGSKLMYEFAYSSNAVCNKEIEKMTIDELKEMIKLSFPELFL
jgi:hypothetical protein